MHRDARHFDASPAWVTPPDCGSGPGNFGGGSPSQPIGRKTSVTASFSGTSGKNRARCR